MKRVFMMNKLVKLGLYIVTGLCMAFFTSSCATTDRAGPNAAVKGSTVTARTTEDVVYMSDIDRLVKEVMLYGVTNGIMFNGTNYVFVVEGVDIQ